ncbi:MAG: hypothetical protein Q9198_006163, partial [Flavoplaca austrocitrina]
KIQYVTQMGLLGLVGEPAIPGETGTSPEGDKEIIKTERGTDTNAEKCKEEVKGQERGWIYPLTTFGNPEAAVGKMTERQANRESQGTLPQDGTEEP